MSQTALLTACQIPDRFGFPSAVRGIVWVCAESDARQTAATARIDAANTRVMRRILHQLSTLNSA
jgi:hypothetical protein